MSYERNSKMNKTKKAGYFTRLAVFILMLTLLMSLPTLQASAESMGIMTENIPDTDIKGATGGADEMVSEIASEIMPNPSTDFFPEGSSPIIPRNDSADTVNDENGSIFGVIIAIAVAISLIMLILAFIPKSKNREDGSGKNDRD